MVIVYAGYLFPNGLNERTRVEPWIYNVFSNDW